MSVAISRREGTRFETYNISIDLICIAFLPQDKVGSFSVRLGKFTRRDELLPRVNSGTRRIRTH
jgi:hypothetical protein